MTTPVSDELRDRFLRRFFGAWPERDVSDEFIRESLRLSTTDGEEGRMLVAELLGYEVGFGFEPGDDLGHLVDELADHIAENAEDDRWVGGDGWRE